MAGFIDGERCFQLIKHKTKWSKTGYSWFATLGIGQVSRDFLETLKSELGVGHIVNQHPNYRLHLTSGQLYHVLPLIIPFLRLKRKRAELLYKAIETLKHRSRGYRNKKVDEELEKLVNQIKMIKPKYYYAEMTPPPPATDSLRYTVKR